jgi:hypothetical protein
MQFDDLDNKIKEAAEQHHPAYDENAWHKMEKLLNKHLPQANDDRRRILFILLLFLLIGGGVFIGINKPWQRNTIAQNKPGEIINTPEQSHNEPDNKTNETLTEQDHIKKVNINKQGSIDNTDKESNNKIKVDQHPVTLIKKQGSFKGKTIKTNNAVLIPIAKANPVINNNESTIEKKDKSTDDAKNVNITNADKNIVNNQVAETKTDRENIITKQQPGVINDSKDNKDNNTDKTQTKPAKKNKINKSKTSNGFAFNFSVGPDASKAGGSKTGKITWVYGAGLSYTKNRFTLRGGVYSAKKVYTAGPTDYKLSYPLPPNIKFVGADADCKVIEIPFNLDYRFGITKQSNWFAGAGLSSYLMKRETYNYNYKSTTGTYSHLYEVKNKNDHYFSILNLSAGYTRQLNHTFSITAEPYVKIPLQGIGEGKVHLNSGGVLFTIGVKPFGSKTKNK